MSLSRKHYCAVAAIVPSFGPYESYLEAQAVAALLGRTVDTSTIGAYYIHLTKRKVQS
jgi:hypothetical protein